MSPIGANEFWLQLERNEQLVQWKDKQKQKHNRVVDDGKQSKPGRQIDDDLFDESEAQKGNKFARLLICLFAIGLLWATSLVACRSLVESLIIGPSISQMEQITRDIFEASEREKEAYKNCAEQDFIECQANYLKTSIDELIRAGDVLEANKAKLVKYKGIRDSCVSNYQQMIFELKDLAQPSGVVPGVGISSFVFEELVEDPKCEVVFQIDARGATGEKGVGLAVDTGNGSEDTILDLDSQRRDREGYDSQYWSDYGEERKKKDDETMEQQAITLASSKINDVSESIVSCLIDGVPPPNSGIQCPDNSGVLGAIDNLIKDVVDEKNEVEAKLKRTRDKLNGIIEAYNTFKRAMDRIPALSRIVNWALPFNLKDLINVKPDYSRVVELLEEMIKANDLDIEKYKAILNESTGLFKKDVRGVQGEYQDAQTEARATQDETNTDIQGQYETLPQDSALDNKTNRADQDKEEFVGQVATILRVPRDNQESLTSQEELQEAAERQAAKLLEDVVARNFQLEGVDQVVFQQFLDEIASFLDYLQYFDTIIRIFQSILLFKKYWKKSAVGAPPANLRVDHDKLQKKKVSPAVKIVQLLEGPFARLSSAFAWVTLITYLVYKVYSPFQEHFVDGCQTHDFNDIEEGVASGTILFQNARGVLVFSAFSEGDRVIKEDLDNLNITRQIECTDRLKSTVKDRAEQIRVFKILQSIQQLNVNNYAAFSDCVDWPAFEEAAIVKKSTLGFQTNYEAEFGFQSCKVLFEGIEESDSALYTCENVLTCDKSQCGSIKERVLSKDTYETACEVERGIHVHLLTALLSTTVFFCVNLSRLYVMRALVQIMVDYVSIGIYSYLASCTENGILLPPKAVGELEKIEKEEVGDHWLVVKKNETKTHGKMVTSFYKVNTFQDVLKKQVERTLKKYKIDGFVQFALAIIVNIPWIVLLVSIVARFDTYAPRV